MLILKILAILNNFIISKFFSQSVNIKTYKSAANIICLLFSVNKIKYKGKVHST